MKNNIKKTWVLPLVITILSLLSVSCDNNYKEINTSTHVVITPPPASIVTDALFFFMDEYRSEWIDGRGVSLIAQYFSQVQYTTESRYDIRSSSREHFFEYSYRSLNHLKQVINLNLERDLENESIRDDAERQISAMRVLKTYIFSTLVDVFGDIPYESYGDLYDSNFKLKKIEDRNSDFQALQLESEKPIRSTKYAKQEDIYLDMLNELDSASTVFEKAEKDEKTIFEGDVLLGGNASRWKKFANSLRLRIAVQVKDVDDKKLSDEAKKIIENLNEKESSLIASIDENVYFQYFDDSPNQNPLYRYRFIDTRDDFRASHTIVDLLKGKSSVNGDTNPFSDIVDPRLEIYFDPTKNVENRDMKEPENIRKYVGMPYGIADEISATLDQGNFSEISTKNVIIKDFSEIIIGYSEVCFLLCEVNDYSSDWYVKGVEASLEKWNVETEKAVKYVESVTERFNAASMDLKQEMLATQQYINGFKQSMVGWNIYRRTLLPKLLVDPNDNATYYDGEEKTYVFIPNKNSIISIPSRIPYPPFEETQNNKNYEEAKQRLGGEDSYIAPLIWTKRK